MNIDQTTVNARKAELLRAFLNQVPGRVSAILDNWHKLVQSDWNNELLTSILERIETLTEASGKFGVIQIKQGGQSLLSLLSEYRDTDSKPQHDDVVAMDGLIHAFRDASIQACNQKSPATNQVTQGEQTSADTATKIFLLGIDETLAPDLTSQLQAHQFQVESVADAEPVFEFQRANPKTPCALLSHTQWLTELFPDDKQAGLWHSEGGFPSMPVAFIADTNDLQTRLSAMRTDAKAYWTQPVDPLVVVTRLQELTSPQRHAAHRILIVDDDPSQADFASAILTKADFDCRSVTDPLKVLDELYDFRPDLVLMDLYMPGASGSELTAIIREQSEFVDTPIVFLSGEQDLDKQLKALSFGGEAFLSKPIGPKHLIKTVTHRIRRANQLTHRLGSFTNNHEASQLFDRNYLLDKVEDRQHSTAFKSSLPAVMYLEVDNADDILLTVGIGGMDAVLSDIAKHLEPQLQTQDVISRFGDNSLGILVGRDSLEQLESFGKLICSEIADKIIEVDDHTLGVTLSIGALPLDDSPQDPRSLFSRAKLASRVAREAGGNQIHIQPPDRPPETAAEAEGDLAKLILKAIEENYFEIHYQPMVALKGTSEAHYQTLIRLQEPDGKLLRAGEFIPMAEKMGIISRIDQWTTRTALNAIIESKKQGTQLHLFISQSTELLENMDRLSWLQEKSRRGMIGENELTMEFRLVEVAQQLNSAKVCFEMLNKIGITTLLTGVTHSAESKRILNHLPLSYIKLDHSLLSGNEKEVKEVIRMAHSLNIKVIAPQVEDPLSVAMLWSSGTDFVQGNFVQRPENNLIYDFNESVLN